MLVVSFDATAVAFLYAPARGSSIHHHAFHHTHAWTRRNICRLNADGTCELFALVGASCIANLYFEVDMFTGCSISDFDLRAPHLYSGFGRSKDIGTATTLGTASNDFDNGSTFVRRVVSALACDDSRSATVEIF